MAGKAWKALTNVSGCLCACMVPYHDSTGRLRAHLPSLPDAIGCDFRAVAPMAASSCPASRAPVAQPTELQRAAVLMAPPRKLWQWSAPGAWRTAPLQGCAAVARDGGAARGTTHQGSMIVTCAAWPGKRRGGGGGDESRGRANTRQVVRTRGGKPVHLWVRVCPSGLTKWQGMCTCGGNLVHPWWQPRAPVVATL